MGVTILLGVIEVDLVGFRGRDELHQPVALPFRNAVRGVEEGGAEVLVTDVGDVVSPCAEKIGERAQIQPVLLAVRPGVDGILGAAVPVRDAQRRLEENRLAGADLLEVRDPGRRSSARIVMKCSSDLGM